MTYFVGIDWADTKHDVCVVNARGEIISEFIISDNQAGFTQLNSYLQNLSSVKISIERPNGRLVDYLLQKRHCLYFIPPNISVAHRPRRAKSDRGDAYLLATLLKNNNPDCRLILKHSELVEQIQQVVIAHDKLQIELQRLALQLRYQLKLYYPAVLEIFAKVQQPITYAFLEDFPDPQQMRTISLQELEKFYRRHKYRYSERIPQHYEVLRQETDFEQETRGYQIYTQAMIALMKTIDQQIRQLRKAMKQLCAEHPDTAWWQTFPGVGELNLARLLAYLGDNRATVSDVDALRAKAGTVPITRSSGKRTAVIFRRDCSHQLRKLFYDIAMKSKPFAPWAKSYFEAQVAKGHARPRANRALANRWVGIIWKLWQSGEVYNEEIHQRNRQKALVLPMAS